MKTIALKVIIEVPDNYVMNEPKLTLEDSILNIEVPNDYVMDEPEWILEDCLNEDLISSVSEVPEFKPTENYTKPMSPEEYIGTIPVAGWSMENIPDTIKKAYEDGKKYMMDAEWHDVVEQYCEKYGIDFWDVIRDIHMMFSDAQKDGSESEEDCSEDKSGVANDVRFFSGNYYLVNVSGKHEYSFMVKTVLEDESDILRKCSEMRLFDDEEDAAYASVSEADEHDLEHFDYFFLN